MGYYKVKNITHTLGKRHPNKDQNLKIEYQIGVKKKHYDLPANTEVMISTKSINSGLHKLRLKKLITITEISENEFLKLQKPSSKVTPTPQPTTTAAPVVAKKPSRKKSNTKKESTIIDKK